MKKLIVALFIALTLLIPMDSHGLKKLGQAGMKFLAVGVGARPNGMGEAFSAVGGDVNALFYNVATIGWIESKFDLTVSVTDWIADIQYNSAGLIWNAGTMGRFGVTIVSPDYGAIPGTRVSATEMGFEETGQLDVNAFALGFCYAKALTDRFSIGGQVKYVSQHLGSNILEADGELMENKVRGTAFDFGTIFYPGFESFGFGVSIRNFSPDFNYKVEKVGEDVDLEAFSAPLTYTIAIAMDILDLFGEHPDQSFVVDIDYLHPKDYTERIHVGGEFSYKDLFIVRSGYKFNYDEAGLTLGVGFHTGGIRVDYAYSDFGRFDAVNRISVGMGF